MVHSTHSNGFQSRDNNFHSTKTDRPSYTNQFPQSPRSLIESARNGWQSKHTGGSQHAPSSSSDNTEPTGWVQMALSVPSAPRFRRYVLVYFTLIILAWISWRILLSPRLQERNSSSDSLDPTSRIGWSGANSPPLFDELIRIRTLDPKLVPTDLTGADAGAASRKRLIIIGDVHGCKDELRQLLAKVSFNQEGGDHLIFVGDIINKGPDSAGVVELARQYSASSVRGNHEDRILLIRKEMLKTGTLDTPADEWSLSSRERGERALARSLTNEQVQWLEDCPVILNIGSVPNMGQVVVVHAGLVPGIELEKQDLASVMTMRTIDLDSHVPSPKKKGMNWAKMFDKHQSVLYSSLESSMDDPRSKTMTVVYGHDASSSLSVRTFTKGLDSGCVKGGMLTALVIEDGGKQNIVQVACREYLKR